MIALPIILLMAAIALFVAGLAADNVTLLTLALVLGAVSGIATIVVTALAKRTQSPGPPPSGVVPVPAVPSGVPSGFPIPPGYVAYVAPTAAAPTAPAAAGPPFAGYDDLRAVDIVHHVRSNGLSRSDLDAIRLYEQEHAGRKTILASVDQMLSRLDSSD